MKHKFKKYTKAFWDYHEGQGAKYNQLYLNPPIEGVIVDGVELFYKKDFNIDSWVDQHRKNDKTSQRHARTLKSFREYNFNEPIPTMVYREGRSKPDLLDGIGRDVNWNDDDVCFPCNKIKIDTKSKRSEFDILEDLKGRQNAKLQKVDNSDNDLIQSMVSKIGRNELENSEGAVFERLRDIEPYLPDKQRLTKLAKKACRIATEKGTKKVLRVSSDFWSPSPYTLFEDFIEPVWENQPVYGWKTRNPKTGKKPHDLHIFNETGQCWQTEITDDKDYIRRSIFKIAENWLDTGHPTEVLLYITNQINNALDLKNQRLKLINGIKYVQGVWDRLYGKKLDWDKMMTIIGTIPQNRARLKDGGEKKTLTIPIRSI